MPLPVRVGNLEGVLDLEDADIVDQDVDLAGGLDDAGDARCGGRVARRRTSLASGTAARISADRARDVGGLAAVDRDFGAAGGKFSGDGKADALGRAGDEGAESGKIDLHAVVSRGNERSRITWGAPGAGASLWGGLAAKQRNPAIS